MSIKYHIKYHESQTANCENNLINGDGIICIRHIFLESTDGRIDLERSYVTVYLP